MIVAPSTTFIMWFEGLAVIDHNNNDSNNDEDANVAPGFLIVVVVGLRWLDKKKKVTMFSEWIAQNRKKSNVYNISF